MRSLRTVVSAGLILVGAGLSAIWLVAHMVVSVVDDGTAVRAMTARALESPAFIDSVGAELSDATAAALRERGVVISGLDGDGGLSDAMTAMVKMPAFHTFVLDQVEHAQAQVVDQLTDPTRAAAPLTIEVDVDQAIGRYLRDKGGSGTELARLNAAPLKLHILDADRVEHVRGVYDKIRWADSWALWLGIGAFALGFVVSHRKRWFIAKALFAVAGIALGLAAIISWVGPDTFASVLPGGGWAGLWHELMGPEASAAFTERSVLVGVTALVGALLALAVGAAVGGRPGRRRTA